MGDKTLEFPNSSSTNSLLSSAGFQILGVKPTDSGSQSGAYDFQFKDCITVDIRDCPQAQHGGPTRERGVN